MQKRDFETYQKRFRDFEILLKFSETHVFRGTIRHPLQRQTIRKRLYIYRVMHSIFFFLLIVLFKEISDYETFRLSVEILKCKSCIYIYSPIPPVKKLIGPDSKFSTGTRCHGFFLIL